MEGTHKHTRITNTHTLWKTIHGLAKNKTPQKQHDNFHRENIQLPHTNSKCIHQQFTDTTY